MSSLSEAEKRKLLRERRAAKFAKGGAGDRLNKITGQNNSQLSTSSPLDSGSPSPSPMPTPTPAPRSKRISQTFAHSTATDADPEIEDIANLVARQSPIPDPLNDIPAEPNQQDLEQIIQNMLAGATPMAPSHKGGADTGSGDPFGGQDIFKQMMAMQQAQAAAGPTGEPVSPQQHQQNQLAFKKFQHRFLIFRLVSVLVLLVYSYRQLELRSAPIKMIYENEFAKTFQYLFFGLELFFFLVYFVNLQRYDSHPGGGILNSIIPLASGFLAPSTVRLLKLLSSYLDLFKNFQVDISLVILFFGIVSIL